MTVVETEVEVETEVAVETEVEVETEVAVEACKRVSNACVESSLPLFRGVAGTLLVSASKDLVTHVASASGVMSEAFRRSHNRWWVPGRTYQNESGVFTE
jgi:hypothetical protein